MENLQALWHRTIRPERAFAARAAEAPELGEAVWGLLAIRTGPAFLATLLGYSGLLQMHGRITRMEGPLFEYLFANLPPGTNPADLRAAFQALPPLPSLGQALPWLLLLAPLGVLSLWLHDAVWDHTCLWLLRGLKGRKSLRVTLVADAEALKVGSLGAALALLGELPGLGCLFSVLLFPIGVYFWVLRGFALAAWHGCPVWKGAVATLLHALLAALFGLGLLAGFLLLVIQELRIG